MWSAPATAKLWRTEEGTPMALRASARAAPGTLRQTVVVAGGHRLTTDQPGGVGGEDLGPSPHELFPAALAACTVWALVSYVAAACPLRRSIENGFTFDERIELAARAA